MALFRGRLDGREGSGSRIHLTHRVASGSGIALAAEESLVAIDTFPGKHAEYIHQAIFQRLGSSAATSRIRLALWTFRVHLVPSTSGAWPTLPIDRGLGRVSSCLR